MTTRSPEPLPTADDLLRPTASPAGPARFPAKPTRAGRRGPPRRRVGRSGRRSRLWVVFVGGAVIIACLAGIVALFGKVRGREFAPTHFQTRSFSFVEIPLLRIQITPMRRTAERSRLSAYLRTATLIARPQGQPAQWHLVELSRGVTRPAAAADAKLLTDYLEQDSAAGGGIPDLYWHQWSLDHPELAATLWPEIQKLAERELYLLIPELFQIASEATSAASLADELHAAIAGRYEQLIGELQAAGQSALAESLRQEAMADYPDDPRWQSLQ